MTGILYYLFLIIIILIIILHFSSFVPNAIIYEFQKYSPEFIQYILDLLLNEDDKFAIIKSF